MSQLLLFFYIQSQFRCVVLVSGTNFTKGRLKRSKGRNTVVPVASGFSLYSLHVCGGVLCRHSSFLQFKDKHMNPLSWKVPEGRRRRRWDLRRDLLLIKSYPTDACSEAPLFFCFFYHTTLICVITTSAATAAAFEVQCYYKQPQRGRQKRCVCVCALCSKSRSSDRK